MARLRSVRQAHDLGLPLAAIADLLALSDDPANPCARADAIAAERLAAVRRRIGQPRALERELARMAACPVGTVGACRVIESLADHARCAGEHERAAPL